MGWNQQEIVCVIWFLPTPPKKTDDGWKKMRGYLYTKTYGIDDPIESNDGKFTY